MAGAIYVGRRLPRNMPLQRKPRKVGTSWVVTLPSDLVRMLEIPEVSDIAYEVIGRDQLLLRLVRRPPVAP